jgi:CRP/FNR family transcriptional regulator
MKALEENCLDCNLCDRSKHVLLSHATAEMVEAVNKEKKTRVFQKGEVLFQQGQHSIGFYFINSGLVRNYSIQPNGKEFTYSIRGSGDWCGFTDAVLGEEHQYTSICLENTIACFIESEFIKEFSKYPDTEKEMLFQMAKECKQLEQECSSLGTLQVHEKIAKYIITLSPYAEKDGWIDIKVTREIMATQMGVTVESMVRAMKDLKERGWIETEKKKVKIHNLPALRQLAFLY